jgi:hypothetical protein
MTVRNRNYLAALLVVVLVGSVFGTASALRGSSSKPQAKTSAAPAPAAPAPQAIIGKTAAGGGCTGSSCTGYNGGNYGNHVTGNSGGNNWLSSNSRVRFDAFRPVPGLIGCAPDDADRGYYDDIGLPRSYSGPTYLHRRVGLDRNDINRVVVGIEDADYFGLGIEINLDSPANAPIQTRPTADPSHAGVGNPTWVGGDWLGNKPGGEPFCLPLNGGGNVEIIKSVVRPQADPKLFATGSDTINGLPRTYFRGVLGMKNSVIEIVIDETGLNNDPSGISAHFDFTKALILVCDDAPEFVIQRQTAPFAGCTWSDSSDSPIYMSATASSFSPDPGNPNILRASVPMKFKRVGNFSFFVIGQYDGTVLYDVNGVPTQVVGQGQVTNVSNVSSIEVFSVKSVNRKS